MPTSTTSKLSIGRVRLLHGLDGAADHEFVVGVWLPIVVLEVSFGIELRPLIIGIAGGRLLRTVLGRSFNHDALLGTLPA